MKPKFNLHEELNKIKSLFGYQRGVVISEQKNKLNEQNPTAKQTEALAAGWGPVSDEYAKSLPTDSNGKIIPKKVEQTQTQTNQVPEKTKADATTAPTKNKTASPTQMKPTAPTAPTNISAIVQMEDDKCKKGKKYVWREVRSAYQYEKQPSTPEGDARTNRQLKKDWEKEGWRPSCDKDIKPKSLKNTPEVASPKINQVEPVTLPTKITAPNLPNIESPQQTMAEKTPEEIYSFLYNNNMVKKGNDSDLWINAKSLPKSQSDKLDQYMDNLGYYFRRIKNRDGSRVYTKKQSEETPYE